MTNDYLIVAKGTEKLGDHVAVSRFLERWMSLSDVQFRPEKYDFGEPLRRSLTLETLPDAVSEWMKSGRAFMFGRTKKPKYLVDVQWRRDQGLDNRMFPWGCSIWLDRAVGDANAEMLFRLLIECVDPVFAYATTEDDERAKHFVRIKDRVGTIEKYVGLEIEHQLPGVYWRTYFGSWAIDLLGGIEPFNDLTCPVVKLDGGRVVRPFEASEDANCGTSISAEAALYAALGEQHFFSLSQFQASSIKVDDVTADAIEKAVAATKQFSAPHG